MISKVSTFLGPNGLYRSGATPSLVLSLDSTNSMSYPPTGFTVSGGGTTHILDERNDIPWDGYGGNYLQGGVFQDSATPLAGWYLVDDNGTIRQVLGDSVWFSSGNPTPILNGGGWFMVLDGPYTISNTYSTSITFYESLPTVGNLYNGSNWFDISKRKNNGTLNDVSLEQIGNSDNILTSLSFNGTGSYISFTQSNGIPLGNSQYSLEVWFNSNSYGPYEQGPFIGWGTIGVTDATNVFRLSGNGLCNYWWGDDLNITFSGTYSMIVGNWYYAIATFDGTNRNIYLNGELKASASPSGANIITDSTTLEIGNFYNAYFNGRISKVKVSDKALSDVRILSNFNTDKVKYGYEFGSMIFNDTQSSYLISSSSDYAFGVNDFTIEAFFKSTINSTYDYAGIVSLKDNFSSYGVAINLQSANTTNPLIEFSVGNSFLAPSPGTGLSLYYIRLIDGGTGNTMFNGFFYVDDSTHIVQTFYDLTNPTVDIRSTGGNGGPTYLYYPGWLCFDGGGCNITSFPYLYGSTQGDYNLYGNSSSSTSNNVDSFINVTYEFSTTPISSSTISYTDSYTASNDKWYHVAISKTGGTSSFFIDGNLFNEVSDNSNYNNTDLSIGRYYTNLSDHYFNGVISNVRVIKGTGLYSGGTITIPTPQLSADTNTKFLINSQRTTPTADLSGNLQSVTSSNIGWTASLPYFPPSYLKDHLELYVDAGVYDSYPGSGTTLYDLSSNVFNMEIGPGSAWDSASGGVIHFDGTYPGSNDLDGPTSNPSVVGLTYSLGYSMEVMVKFDSVSGNQGIFTFCGNNWGSSGYINLQLTGQSLRWEFTGNSTGSFYPAYTFNSGIWYHIVATYDGSFGVVYVNGIIIGSLIGNGINTTHTISKFALGSWDGKLQGDIGFARFYSKALLSDDVNTNFNSSKTRFGL